VNTSLKWQVSSRGTVGLIRNTGWNLVGQLVPLLVAVFSIPGLLRNLGTERFGILTIAWTVFVYFGLFDFGLGRALTQSAAERIGTDRGSEVVPIMWTGLAMMVAFGVLGGVIATLGSPYVMFHIFQVPPALRSESVLACRIFSLSLPFVIATTGLSGILGAVQRFDVLNQLRIPQGIFTYFAPWIVSIFSPRLPLVMAVLLFGRITFCLLHFVFCFRVIPELLTNFAVKKRFAAALLRFGGWVTVSNIVGPIMTYFDRFFIGAWVSIAAVSYYATPHEAVNRLFLIPAAIASALFPAISGTSAGKSDEAGRLFARAMDLTAAVLFPIIAVVVLFANEGLTVWLGAGFAAYSFRILQFLAIGVLVNGLAQSSFTLVQGAGRADLTAKFQLAELPIYIVTLRYLLTVVGLEGAAIAWLLRVFLDMILLFFAVAYLIRSHQGLIWGKFFEGIGLTFLLVGCAAVSLPLHWRLSLLGILALLYLGYCWRIVLRGMRPAELVPFMRMLWSGQ
jgi:O-antigen/teichoic acid export membrane protein